MRMPSYAYASGRDIEVWQAKSQIMATEDVSLPGNVIDEHIVLDGSFNWYNTSTFSHDLLVVAADERVAGPYLFEFEQILDKFRLYSQRCASDQLHR